MDTVIHHLKHSDACHSIGLLAPRLQNSSTQQQWWGILDAMHNHQVNVICFIGGILCDSEDFRRQENALYQMVSTERLDGLILASPGLSAVVSGEDFQNFYQRYAPLPMVSLQAALSKIPSVLMSDYEGMRELMTHMIEEHDYRRIVFLRGSETHAGMRERYRAYADTLEAHGIALDPILITPPYWSVQQSERIVSVLLDERKLRPHVDVDAIVGASDNQVMAALRVLRDRGIDLPSAGFDDDYGTRYFSPPLTTVRPPFYEIGRQAAELLWSLLQGKSVPDKVVLTSQVIIRQSCGCQSLQMLQAEGDPDDTEQIEFAARILPAFNRETILKELRQFVGEVPEVSEWADDLLDGFIFTINAMPPADAAASSEGTASSQHFLLVLDRILHRLRDIHQDISVWQNALSCMQRHALRAWRAPERVAHIQRICRQARVLIGEQAEAAQASRRLRVEAHTARMREIGADLVTIADIHALMERLTVYLPEIGIPSAFVSLYVDPARPAGDAQLILAYEAGANPQICSKRRAFPSTQLVPDELLPRGRHAHFIVKALYFQEEPLGFALFETGPRDADVYEVLRTHISSALHTALLLRRVRDHAQALVHTNAEITRQKYILDTFMDTVPDSIYFKDREGRIIRANNAHARSLGLTDPVEEVGKTDFDFFAKEQARAKYEQEQAIMRSGQAAPAFEEQANDDCWLLTTKMPLRDESGEIIGIFGLSRDISEQKRAERTLRDYRDHLEELVEQRTDEVVRINSYLHEQILERQKAEQALQQSEQQYRLMAETVKDGILILQDSRIVFVNAAIAVMLKMSPERLSECDSQHLLPVAARELNRLDAPPAPVEPERAAWQVELLDSDGQSFWAEIEHSAIIWNNQPALLLTVRNINHSKLREMRLEEERIRLRQENQTFKSTMTERYRFGSLVGKSLPMQRVYELLMSAALSDVNTLIVGESGTGKELIARSIYQVSARKEYSFVPVNCASIPETLFEREFFGHHKGAFTGADRDKPGFFDRAHRGILFLDEVTELQPGTQAKLLRVLQDGEYTPLGSNTPKQADVLIVAATNKDCQKEIAEGRLRQDFYYRICVIRIMVSPLRERKDDLALLIEHLLSLYGEKQQRLGLERGAPSLIDLPAELAYGLSAYDWPGNVRELQNVLQHFLATRDAASTLALIGNPISPTFTAPCPDETAFDETTLPKAIEKLERQMIAATLTKTKHNRLKTSRMLGITPRTLYKKLAKYGLLDKKRL